MFGIEHGHRQAVHGELAPGEHARRAQPQRGRVASVEVVVAEPDPPHLVAAVGVQTHEPQRPRPHLAVRLRLDEGEQGGRAVRRHDLVGERAGVAV